jgi:hypothetical protein
MYQVYGLTDPREPERIRYVGCSRNALARRRGHLYTRGRLPIHQWIQSLRRAGVRVEMVILASGMGKTEYKWIQDMQKRGMADLNLKTGSCIWGNMADGDDDDGECFYARIDRHLHTALRDRANAERRTMNDQLNVALEEHLVGRNAPAA